MKEENYLKQAYGTETPFKVPEGYFDDFATRMMEMKHRPCCRKPSRNCLMFSELCSLYAIMTT